jgi:hypothetical protein
MIIPPYHFFAVGRFLESEGTISAAVGDDQHLFGETFKFRILAQVPDIFFAKIFGVLEGFDFHWLPQK